MSNWRSHEVSPVWSVPIYWFPLRKVGAFLLLGFPAGSEGKESARNAQDPGSILSQEDPLMKGMATPSSILAWRIPWAEKPGGLQSMGSQRIRHDWVTNTVHFLILLIIFQHIFFTFSPTFSKVQMLSFLGVVLTERNAVWNGTDPAITVSPL